MNQLSADRKKDHLRLVNSLQVLVSTTTVRFSLGALETVGGTQQAQEQRALDIAYEDFARETTRPSQQVQEMSSVLRDLIYQIHIYNLKHKLHRHSTTSGWSWSRCTRYHGAGKGVGYLPRWRSPR